MKPAYIDGDLVKVHIIQRDSGGWVRNIIDETDRVIHVGNRGIKLDKNGYLKYDEPFPQWSVRKATDEESMIYLLENL